MRREIGGCNHIGELHQRAFRPAECRQVERRGISGAELRRERGRDLLGRRGGGRRRFAAAAQRDVPRYGRADRRLSVDCWDQHHEIDHRSGRRHHDVTQPVGDLAVGEFQQDVERAVELGERELFDETAGCNRPLDAAAEFRKRHPAS